MDLIKLCFVLYSHDLKDINPKYSNYVEYEFIKKTLINVLSCFFMFFSWFLTLLNFANSILNQIFCSQSKTLYVDRQKSYKWNPESTVSWTVQLHSFTDIYSFYADVVSC